MRHAYLSRLPGSFARGPRAACTQQRPAFGPLAQRLRLLVLASGLACLPACDVEPEEDEDDQSEDSKDSSKAGSKDSKDSKDSPDDSDDSPKDKDSVGKDSDDTQDSEDTEDSSKDSEDTEDSEDSSKDSDDKSKDSATRGAFVTANIDDDNKNGRADFEESHFDADNDIADWTLPVADKGDTMELRFSGDVDKLKIWKDGKDWMGAGDGKVKSSHSLSSTGKDLKLQVEMGDYNAQVTLEVSSKSRGSQSYRLAASPLMLNHHLQPGEKVWIVQDRQNQATVSGFRKALGSKLSVISGSSYKNDVWLQDEIEFGTMLGMNGARIDVVLDSIRNRGLDAFPERELTTDKGRTKDWVLGVYGRGRATSGDSFGNLEVTPPVTVDGTSYPLGRIYFGNKGNGKLNDTLAKFLRDQKVQAPFAFDTSWLCVSHVDEVLTFVPHKDAPRGFLMLIADTDAGYKMLESMNASDPLSRYSRYRTVGSMLQDRALRDQNEEIQQDALDPTRELFIKELGLSEKEIIRVPSLFHDVTGCRGPATAAALIPGTVNMVVVPGEKGEPTKLIMPDPFFRASSADQSQDKFISYFKKLVPKDLELHFVDDWETYHLKHGEVHCASNTKRPPAGKWWESDLSTTRCQEESGSCPQ